MSDALLSKLADRFWEAAGRVPPEPRDLGQVASLAIPVAVIYTPALTVERIQIWLAQRGIPYCFDCASRRLRGCLVAAGGHGIIFIEGADPDDERRFTLAHEIAHFLVHYQHPRERALRRLGPGILPVLDGLREPTPEERIDAALAGCPLGVHTHLLERSGDAGALAAGAESEADRLAWELLAPAQELRRVPAGDRERVLQARFGLPRPEAARYARWLRRRFDGPPAYLDWLRS
ncbi:MAG: hypothetical protein KatS3mg059_1031 [Thermomicrobiales bacterium]|nr:MAG: hypothetical protein KatS3mg059_1031 [Thermomicrobiales bacterium]